MIGNLRWNNKWGITLPTLSRPCDGRGTAQRAQCNGIFILVTFLCVEMWDFTQRNWEINKNVSVSRPRAYEARMYVSLWSATLPNE